MAWPGSGRGWVVEAGLACAAAFVSAGGGKAGDGLRRTWRLKCGGCPELECGRRDGGEDDFQVIWRFQRTIFELVRPISRDMRETSLVTSFLSRSQCV